MFTLKVFPIGLVLLQILNDFYTSEISDKNHLMLIHQSIEETTFSKPPNFNNFAFPQDYH